MLHFSREILNQFVRHSFSRVMAKRVTKTKAPSHQIQHDVGQQKHSLLQRIRRLALLYFEYNAKAPLRRPPPEPDHMSDGEEYQELRIVAQDEADMNILHEFGISKGQHLIFSTKFDVQYALFLYTVGTGRDTVATQTTRTRVTHECSKIHVPSKYPSTNKVVVIASEPSSGVYNSIVTAV
eukprot:m.341656 g.341656  ORF g.341656 m.341656 type:complete len:181 (-) comp16114_c0_seq5:3094-3636(-)